MCDLLTWAFIAAESALIIAACILLWTKISAFDASVQATKRGDVWKVLNIPFPKDLAQIVMDYGFRHPKLNDTHDLWHETMENLELCDEALCFPLSKVERRRLKRRRNRLLANDYKFERLSRHDEYV